MNNLFLVQLYNWASRDDGLCLRCIQAFLRRVGVPWILRRSMDPTRDMANPEIRQNLWHFASQTVAYGVKGDFACFGCFDGKTAVIYQKVLEHFGYPRRLHLYDHFQCNFQLGDGNVRGALAKNFELAGVRPAVVQRVISAPPFRRRCLRRSPAWISTAAVGPIRASTRRTFSISWSTCARGWRQGRSGVLMDYYEPGTTACPDYNPGVGRACRKFFARKPEKVHSLWADEYAQGYFRKVG